MRATPKYRLRITHTRKKLCDIDNLSVKAVIDGLVLSGTLSDDSPDYVSEVTHCQVSGRTERTVIEIEEVS